MFLNFIIPISLTTLVVILLVVSLVTVYGSYRVFKWPILMFISGLLFLEFVGYLTLRYTVSFSEFLFYRISSILASSFTFFAPNSVTARYRERSQVEQYPESFQAWKEAALGLDELEGRAAWKSASESRYYDAAFIDSLLTELKVASLMASASLSTVQFDDDLSVAAAPSHPASLSSASVPLLHPKEDREQYDATFVGQERFRDAILAATHKNIAGIETPELFHPHWGTKELIEKFTTTLARSLRSYYHKSSSFLPKSPIVSEQLMMLAHQNLQFYQRLRRAYGRVALCLSGGAAFGNYHWGLIRALFDLKELPSVISGTSAGAFAAAFLGTRTNAEIESDLRPEVVNQIMQGLFHESFITLFRRLWQRGGLLDSEKVESLLLKMTKGPMTFLEAFQLTGRHLNISIQPSGKYRTTMVFNHLTSPDVVIATAIMASAAIPYMLDRPVVMKKKCPISHIISPYHTGARWSDGSFQGDIPMQTLRELFSCSYFIVSQVNPHIAPFFYSNRVRPLYSRIRGRFWRGGFITSALEAFFKLEMQKNLKLIAELDLLPSFLGQNWNELFLQEFEGQATIVPQLSPKDYLYLFSDPTLPRMKHYFKQSAVDTWRKISQIRTRSVVANAIEECEKLAKRRYKELSKEYHRTRGVLFSPMHPTTHLYR